MTACIETDDRATRHSRHVFRNETGRRFVPASRESFHADLRKAFGHGPGVMLDYVKQQLRLESDRPNVMRQAMQACRKGGNISIPGVYGGILDALNFGAAWNKGLKFAMGQTNMHKYLDPLMQRIRYLDKLIDEIAKGRPMAKVLRAPAAG